MHIDCDFPGGNILVEKVEGDSVFLRQDLRDTSEWWFYWCFRVTGAAHRTVRFQFTDGNVFGALGPCVSRDQKLWRWLGKDSAQNEAFEYTFTPDEDEVYFSFCPTYVEENLRDFLAEHSQIQPQTLCVSEKGREVEHLLIPSTHGEQCVVIMARTHACETLASFVLEGILNYWLHDNFLRESVDLHAIPFFDKDGVEQGDQGKFRAPHDHNRDFTEQPLYASNRALMQQIHSWRGQPAAFFDLHCPYIRDGRNEEIFLIGEPQPWESQRTRFAEILQNSQQGELVYDPRHTIAFGEEWNSDDKANSCRWAREHWNPSLVTTLEMPYAFAGGQTVTPQNARQFGHDFARALSLYLQEL